MAICFWNKRALEEKIKQNISVNIIYHTLYSLRLNNYITKYKPLISLANKAAHLA